MARFQGIGTVSKMLRDDRFYYQRRAESEIELAQSATDQRAVRAHYELACAYLDIIYPAAEAGRAEDA
jgi:hypothetical protein